MPSTRSRITSNGGRSSGFSLQQRRISSAQKGGQSAGMVGRRPRVPTANTTCAERREMPRDQVVVRAGVCVCVCVCRMTHLEWRHSLKGIVACYHFPQHNTKTAKEVSLNCADLLSATDAPVYVCLCGV